MNNNTTHATHTPGPWTVRSGSVVKYDNSRPSGEIPIASMDRESGNGTAPAERDDNARLIAAAPELLAACQVAIAMMEGDNLDEKFDGEAEVIRDAIARATGKAR